MVWIVRFLLLLSVMMWILWCGSWVKVFNFRCENGKLVVNSGWDCVCGVFLCMLSRVIFLCVSKVVWILV